MSTTENKPAGVRPARRTVVKGAAWAVPAVMVASAAPAAAQSPPPPCLQVGFSGDSCKCPGAGNSWSYQLSVCFFNNCETEVTVQLTNLITNSGVTLQPPPNDVLVIGAGGSACTPLREYTSSNSAHWIDVHFNLNGVPQQPFRLANPPDCASCPGDD